MSSAPAANRWASKAETEMRERDIISESVCGRFWIGRDTASKAYVVYRVGATHSVSDSGYAMTPDGLSIAKARMAYLERRAA
jgi:hypothetical protein